jgi:hypothetical protein
MSQRHLKILLGLSLALILIGESSCKKDDFGKDNNEQKPVSSVTPTPSPTPGETNKVVAKSKYLFEVKKTNGDVLCSGEVQAETLADFQLLFPEETVKCKIVIEYDLNLKKMLNPEAPPRHEDLSEYKSLPHFGKVLRKKYGPSKIHNDKIYQGEFKPPRPYVLGPIIQDSAIFKDFSVEETIQLVVEGGEKAISTSGTVKLKVLEHKMSYKPQKYDRTFDQVIRWEFSSTGFEADGLNKSDYMLFDRMEFYWNIRPILIPRIVIEGKISNFMEGFIGSVGNVLVGPVVVSLDMIEHTQIEN